MILQENGVLSLIILNFQVTTEPISYVLTINLTPIKSSGRGRKKEVFRDRESKKAGIMSYTLSELVAPKGDELNYG